MVDNIQALYQEYAEMPYISPQRDVAQFLAEVALSKGKLVPKRNMIRLAEGHLPGHIILLWRIQFGTYTNETVISKYFEYTYGIDAKKELQHLIEQGYAYEESAHDSLDHITAPMMKQLLKDKNIAGLSKLSKAELVSAIETHVTPDELAQCFTVRGYALTPKGEGLLAAHPEVIDKHPQKKF
ncbi:MAG: hypothetical protein Q4B80_05290 [Aerococcaceae bacterium]|nr:hypothetical protein [Aerococcaceae bacterium]